MGGPASGGGGEGGGVVGGEGGGEGGGLRALQLAVASLWPVAAATEGGAHRLDGATRTLTPPATPTRSLIPTLIA